MKKTMILLLTLGAFTPSVLFSQYNNRIGVQTGLFHHYFDKSPIVGKFLILKSNIKLKERLEHPNHFFGSFLKDSHGFFYERKLNPKSLILLEYMSLDAIYSPKEELNHGLGPVITSKLTKKISLTYFRKLSLSNKINFVYGGGLDYVWGLEQFYLYSIFAGWGWESHYYIFSHNDFGINIRTGVEYSPIPRITLFTHFNFLGIVYSGVVGQENTDPQAYFHQNYGIDYLPSKLDLSWQFGLGFNFK